MHHAHILGGTAEHRQTPTRPHLTHTLSSGSQHTHCFHQRKLRTLTAGSSSRLSSSAGGPTMPPPAHHSLIPFLLSWIAILSVVQVVFIVFFFTAGHHGLKGSSAAPERPMQFQANDTPSKKKEDEF
ncbi:hypothetical protein EYF80_019396 [Liparis tanakae]|uniref:Uncharacterized protein n=1 Tax=Liparis tanakae TaxID=230148 RepID=A0A4Z2HXW0_9TELE|nr:hypothetical protein EYF80_019396 [Liparis tanakae]